MSIPTVIEQLQKTGITIDGSNPNTRLDENAYRALVDAFQPDRAQKKQSDSLSGRTQQGEQRTAAPKEEKPKETPLTTVPKGPKVIGHIKLDANNEPVKEEPAPAPVEKPAAEKPVAEKPVAEKPAAAEKPVEAPRPEKTEAQAAPAAPVQPEKAPEAPRRESEQIEKPAEKPAPKPVEPKPAPAPAPAPAPKEEKPKETPRPVEKPAEKPAPATPAAPVKSEPEVFTLGTTPQVSGPKVIGQIDLSALNQSTRPKKKSKEEKRNERKAQSQAQQGQGQGGGDRKKRRRIGGKEKIDIEKTAGQGGNSGNGNQGGGNNQGGNNRGVNNNRGANDRNRDRGNKNRDRRPVHVEVNEEDVQKQVRETLARLTNKEKGQKKGAKWRKEKREAFASRASEAAMQEAAESKVLKLTEFVTANDLASMMDVPINNVIATCMNLGVMVSINQRLDAE
ncbi:MAG: translation initiation factor IF-2 N-terminal domain-containing protein, partial [Duncaniella sp.]|nr:translation initiation factor IF-2 N-terminal domain-containing protein [Duncaniella sp.]